MPSSRVDGPEPIDIRSITRVSELSWKPQHNPQKPDFHSKFAQRATEPHSANHAAQRAKSRLRPRQLRASPKNPSQATSHVFMIFLGYIITRHSPTSPKNPNKSATNAGDSYKSPSHHPAPNPPPSPPPLKQKRQAPANHHPPQRTAGSRPSQPPALRSSKAPSTTNPHATACSAT